ncbi:uncharacterized protein isoform X2 [Macaca fascicularis]|uniref:uncharacterized protein isoform X2 n=1 Tax=Macaca fascicularis TaxID=9541 RepID=UPI003D158A3F
MSKMKALPNSTSGEGGFLTRRRLLPVSSHGLYSVRTWRESSPVPPSSDEVTSSISSRDGKSKIKALEDSLSDLFNCRPSCSSPGSCGGFCSASSRQKNVKMRHWPSLPACIVLLCWMLPPLEHWTPSSSVWGLGLALLAPQLADSYCGTL